MCRSIKTLYHFNPPATDEEIYAASLQFVRKISGFRKPSLVNMAIFENAVQNISKIVTDVINSLETNVSLRHREMV